MSLLLYKTMHVMQLIYFMFQLSMKRTRTSRSFKVSNWILVSKIFNFGNLKKRNIEVSEILYFENLKNVLLNGQAFSLSVSETLPIIYYIGQN